MLGEIKGRKKTNAALFQCGEFRPLPGVLLGAWNFSANQTVQMLLNIQGDD